jgi:TRAP-type transport system small permease protein
MLQLHRWLSRTLATLVGVALAAMVLLTLMQIVWRYFFSAAFVWVEEASVMILIAATWLGIAYLWLERRHIDVDLFTRDLPLSARRRFDRVADLIAIVVGAAIVYLGVLTVRANAGLQIAALDLDTAWKYLPVVVGGALLAVAGTLNLFVPRVAPQKA